MLNDCFFSFQLSGLHETVWRRSASEESLWIWSIREIDSQLWCCVKNRIEIRNSDLTVARVIAKPTDDRLVYDVTQRDSDHVFIATSKGVFLINKSGLIDTYTVLACVRITG